MEMVVWQDYLVSVEAHQPCPYCSSSDAYTTYSYEYRGVEFESGYCYSCGCGVNQVEAYNMKTQGRQQQASTYSLPEESKPITKTFRGISPEVYNHFGVVKVGMKMYFPYYNKNGKLVGAKVRDFSKPKDTKGHFSIEGSISDALFGSQVANTDYAVVLHAGEFDALACFEALGRKVSSISVPNGDGKQCKKSLVENFDWLDSYFAKVVVCPDNDAGGERFKEEVTNLGLDRLYVMTLPHHKDTNDYVMAGATEDYKRCYYGAKKVSLPWIDDNSTLIQEYLERRGNQLLVHGMSTGCSTIDSFMSGGLRLNELTVVLGDSGKGKSTFGRSILAGLLEAGVPSMYVSQEECNRECLTIVSGMLLGYNRYEMHTEDVPENHILTTVKYLEDKLFMFNGSEVTSSIKSFASSLRKAIKQTGVQFVIIDHISGVSQLAEGDEFRNTGALMVELAAIVKDLPCHILTFAHQKNERADEDGETKMNKNSGYGGSNLHKYAHTYIGLTTDMQSKTTYLELFKCRYDGSLEGSTAKLAFRTADGRLVDLTARSQPPNRKHKLEVIHARTSTGTEDTDELVGRDSSGMRVEVRSAVHRPSSSVGGSGETPPDEVQTANSGNSVNELGLYTSERVDCGDEGTDDGGVQGEDEADEGAVPTGVCESGDTVPEQQAAYRQERGERDLRGLGNQTGGNMEQQRRGKDTKPLAKRKPTNSKAEAFRASAKRFELGKALAEAAAQDTKTEIEKRAEQERQRAERKEQKKALRKYYKPVEGEVMEDVGREVEGIHIGDNVAAWADHFPKPDSIAWAKAPQPKEEVADDIF